jgi:hypothetical protein
MGHDPLEIALTNTPHVHITCIVRVQRKHETYIMLNKQQA